MDYIEGDLETADLLIYGTDSQLTKDMVEEQQSKFMENLLPNSVAFFSHVLNMQKELAKNRAVQIAKGAFRKARSLWQEDDIRTLKTIGEFQNAPDRMKRYIMAEPTIRAMWLRQLCSGYNDICDYNKHQSGEDLMEYRHVMNGMIVTDTDEELDHEFTIFDHPEDTMDKNEITTAEQFDIHETWDNLKVLIAKGEEDPTSEENEWLSV